MSAGRSAGRRVKAAPVSPYVEVFGEYRKAGRPVGTVPEFSAVPPLVLDRARRRAAQVLKTRHAAEHRALVVAELNADLDWDGTVS